MSRAGRLRACVGVALASAGSLSAAQPQDVVTLGADAVIEQHLDRDHAHRYQIGVAAGECVRVIVEQRGVDAVVDVLDPTGLSIAQFQDEVGYQGEEHADLVADKATTYTLAIGRTPGASNDPTASYVIRLGSRHAASKADRAMWEARTLSAAGKRLDQQGRFTESRPLFEHAVREAEGVRGAEDAYVGVLWSEVAGAAAAMLDNAAADALYDRALKILDKQLGPEHPSPAWVRTRQAMVREHTGQLRDAEALLQPALATLEKTLGPEHPLFLRSLIAEANIRNDLGDFDKMEEISRRVATTLEETHQTESQIYVGALNTLGEAYRQKQNYAEAEKCYTRALELAERLGGKDSRDVALELQNLAIVARQKKDYTTAVAYDMRALAIKERTVGPDHFEVGQILNNLAILYHGAGDDIQALETYARVLRIFERATGPYHRATLTVVGNLERLYAAAGDVPHALTYQHRADAIIEKQLELNLTIGSERQKLAFVRGIAERTDRTVSLHLIQAPENADAAALAALVVLQRKGRVLDAMTDTFGAVRQRIADTGDPGLLERLDQLKTTTAQFARVALSGAPDGAAAEHQRQIEELQGRIEQLEADLNLHSADFRAQLRPVTLDAVQAAIPDDAALVEFAVFRPFDPRTEMNEDAYGPPHYAAYVLRRHGPPVGLDLGPTKPIDEAIAAWREALRDPARRDQFGRARAVDAQVMRPLRPAIGNAARLLISPDGDLNLAPFEAMVDEQQHYLVERCAISYVTSGRDLLRMQDTRNSRGAPVIVADPLFGEPPVLTADAKNQKPPVVTSGDKARSTTTAEDMSSMYFPPLVASAAEARAIKALFPESTLLLGASATKGALQHLDAPRVLHIASHGFFLQERASVRAENPLLRSGVALAGANLRHDAHDTRDDGILTAMEASGLNLWGTKLVTLSACDTGIGEVRNGEGVYGLRRAFVLAGAETLVMSLWPVSDSIARETMTAYYTGLRAGLGRGEALRQAKLSMLKRQGRRHPFYWASFIQSGEWANLDGRR
jgi:CHAT domain-containing protein